MSDKPLRLMRKETKRHVDKNLGRGYAALSRIVRPRPRWIPKRVWVWAYAPLFTKKHREEIIKYIA